MLLTCASLFISTMRVLNAAHYNIQYCTFVMEFGKLHAKSTVEVVPYLLSQGKEEVLHHEYSIMNESGADCTGPVRGAYASPY
jgi:hypothetical protein